MAMGSGNRGTMLSEINVTPLVDVMLVLLIIFMVTAPLTQEGVKVAVPEASSQPMGKKQGTPRVAITKSGAVFINKKKVAQLDLGSAVTSSKNLAALENVRLAASTHKKLQADKEAHIEGHHRLAYGWVVNVMVKLQEAKVTKLGLVTRPPDVE